MDVRPEERFDEDRLAAHLEEEMIEARGRPRVRQFGGGAANLTYLLQYPDHELVLRRPPRGPVPDSTHDMKREFEALQYLYPPYPVAPEGLYYCGDPSVIGSEFFVMERRCGVVVRREMPKPFRNLADAPQRMSGALVDALADLHAVDYETVGMGAFGQPDGFVERQVERGYARWQAAKPEALDDVDRTYAWLMDHLPASSRRAPVHNDFKLDNVMLDPSDPGRVVAVFDWDMCTLGDPLVDLGTLLAYWVQPSDPKPFRRFARMPVDERFPDRTWLADRYAQRSGQPVPNLRFYHALGLFRLVVIVAQIHRRYLDGQTSDPRFATLGAMTPAVARAARDVTEGTFPS